MSTEDFELFSCLLGWGKKSISYELISDSLDATFNPMHNLYSYPRTAPLSGPAHLPLSRPPALTGLAGLRNKEQRSVVRGPNHKIVRKKLNNDKLNLRWKKMLLFSGSLFIFILM